MLSLINIELIKIFRKWRSYLGYFGITAMVIMIQINLYLDGSNYVKHITKSLNDSFFISGNLLNGYLIGLLILNAFFILFPLTIILVAGEILAGEATAGTYRLIVTRPISRVQLLLSKFIAGNVYILTILFWMAIVSLFVSLMIFGSGELIVIEEGLSIFAKNDVLWRFLLAYVHIFLSMTLVFSLAFLFSSFVENAVGPMIATMAILIALLIISQLPLDLAEQVKPYIFTNYMMDWNKFFGYTIDWNSQLYSSLFLFGHSIIFLIVTIIIFIKKDILS